MPQKLLLTYIGLIEEKKLLRALIRKQIRPVFNRTKLISALIPKTVVLSKPIELPKKLIKINYKPFRKLALSTINVESKSNTPGKKRIINLIQESRQAFIHNNQSVKTLASGVKVFTQQINGIKYRIFGVRSEDQTKINFEKLRQEISEELAFNETKDFIQIIGDSQNFSPKGTDFCRNYLSHLLNKYKENIILYGLTGHVDQEIKADTNQFLSEWLDQDINRSKRVVANVVDKHTVEAIDSWGCTVPDNITNFFLVYTDGPKAEVKFGIDIPSSDGLTNSLVICFDGGMQSLRQIICMLNNNIKITCLQNLRDLKDPKSFDETSKLPYLSAGEYLSFLKDKIKNTETVSENKIKEYSKEYLSTHALYSPKQVDGDKAKLLNDAMEQFYQKEIWKKLYLFDSVSITNIKPESASKIDSIPTDHIVERHHRRNQF